MQETQQDYQSVPNIENAENGLVVNLNLDSKQSAAMIKMGGLSPEALMQAYKNIDSFDPKWSEMLENEVERPDITYEEFVEQLKFSQPNEQFKIFKDIPTSVLTDVNQLDRSCFSLDSPILIEFAVRFANDASFDKLVTVPTNITVSQMRQYIFHRIVNQLYTKAHTCEEVRKALPVPEKRPVLPSQITIFWTNKDSAGEATNLSQQQNFEKKEVILSDDNQQLRELISQKLWRIDNLTPGLDYIDNFWNLALQENNYELIREKLYFRLE